MKPTDAQLWWDGNGHFKRPRKADRRHRRLRIRAKRCGPESMHRRIGAYHGDHDRATFAANHPAFGCNAGVKPIAWWEIEWSIERRERRRSLRGCRFGLVG